MLLDRYINRKLGCMVVVSGRAFHFFAYISFLAVVALLNVAPNCEAQDYVQQKPYPNRPVMLIAPWGRGGESDIASRMLSAVAYPYLGESVIVENRTGNGGMTGADYVHKAEPDGYTLLLARVGCITAPAAMRKEMPFVYNDFAMLGLLEINPGVLIVGDDSPWQTLEGLISDIKQRPGRISYAHRGSGNLPNIAILAMLERAGIPKPLQAVKGIYYSSVDPVFEDLASGDLDFVFTSMSLGLPRIRNGEARALMMNSPERHSLLPDIPTARELGYPELEVITGWSAVFAPPNTPHEIVEKWEQVLEGVKNDRAWRRVTTALGSIPLVLAPGETRKFVDNQYRTLSEQALRMGLVKGGAK